MTLATYTDLWLDELHSSYSGKDISRAKRWRMKRAAAWLRCRIQKPDHRFALADCQVFAHDIQSCHPTDLSSSTDGDTQGWTPDQVQDSTSYGDLVTLQIPTATS
ncbi:hypothetical protein V1527DRAFT_459984 [Lipomyces starkeyi]